MEIVDGFHRWKACEALEIDPIPVVFVEMSPAQMRVATLRHNRARGTEDVQLSAQVLREIQELSSAGYVQSGLMLSDAELSRLVKDLTPPEPVAPGEAVGPAHREAQAQIRSEDRLLSSAGELHRISAVYGGEEAEVVNAILGEVRDQADRLTAVCQYAEQAGWALPE